MKRFPWLLAAWALANCGCSERLPPPPTPMAPLELLARVKDLATHHRIVEALELIESQRAVVEGLDPKLPTAFALREQQALLYLNVSRTREAAERLEDLVRFQPENWRLRGFLGQAYLELGEAARAVSVFETLPPGELRKHLPSHGEALVAAGRRQEGLAALAASLVVDPWQASGYLALGRALTQHGKEIQGGHFLERYRRDEVYRRADQEALAFEAQGESAHALHRRARAELERGRFFEAIELEQRALQVRRGLGDAYLALARISLRLARPQDAIGVLERLPEDPAVARLLAEARDEAARSDGPRASLRDRMAGRPLSACVPELVELADALARAGESSEARAVALFAVRLEGKPRRETAAGLMRQLNAPDDVFVRLWVARALQQGAPLEAVLEAELSPLAIDAALARKMLGLFAP